MTSTTSTTATFATPTIPTTETTELPDNIGILSSKSVSFGDKLEKSLYGEVEEGEGEEGEIGEEEDYEEEGEDEEEDEDEDSDEDDDDDDDDFDEERKAIAGEAIQFGYQAGYLYGLRDTFLATGVAGLVTAGTIQFALSIIGRFF